MWWSSSSGRIELEMTAEQAVSVSHQGRCDEDVEYLIEQPEIKKQLDAIPNSLMASELAEYGTWDGEQLRDNDDNRARLVWIAGCDLDENGHQN
jgi:hypothetical protein